MHDQPESVATVAAKISPPVAVMGAELLNMSVAEWIQWLTLLYLILLVSHRLWVTGLEAHKFWFADKEAKKTKEVQE